MRHLARLERQREEAEERYAAARQKQHGQHLADLLEAMHQADQHSYRHPSGRQLALPPGQTTRQEPQGWGGVPALDHQEAPHQHADRAAAQGSGRQGAGRMRSQEPEAAILQSGE